MVKIDCVSFLVSDREVGRTQRRIAENIGHDSTGTLVSSVDEAVKLLRYSGGAVTGFTRRFRTTDFPSITFVWHQIRPSAAIAFQVVDSETEKVHLLLGGRNHADDVAAIRAIKRVLGTSFPRHKLLRNPEGGPVTHAVFSLRDDAPAGDTSDLLGFIAIVPIFCELCGIT